MSGTQFQIQIQILDRDLNTAVVDATSFSSGVLMNMGGWEVFCILNSECERRWIAYSGEIYNDYEFAELARKCNEFLSKDYRAFDASELPDGTVVNMAVWAFFKPDNPDMWVSNTGRFHTNEGLADILRDYTGPIQVGDAVH